MQCYTKLYLKSSSSLKLTVKTNDVNGFSLPRSFVWFPRPLKTETKGVRKIDGCVGSSQHKGIEHHVSSEMTNCPDDCETICIPINLLVTFSAVDFPLAVSPTAVVTGQQSVK